MKITKNKLIKNKSINNKLILGIMIASILFLASCTLVQDAQKACTADAKLCPDGTAVGRTGPDCEFAQCSGDAVDTTNPVSDSAAGSSCVCPQGFIQEGDVCNPTCYYSTPKCLMPSVQCEKTDKKECGQCPYFAPPAPTFCQTGRIIEGPVDECGCQGHPICVVDTGSQACTEEAKICPDGTAVGRTGPNCDFAPCPSTGSANPTDPQSQVPTQDNLATKCPAERSQACTMDYNPVCGYFDESIKCIRYPCAMTYSNGCSACANENVAYYEQGECPK